MTRKNLIIFSTVATIAIATLVLTMIFANPDMPEYKVTYDCAGGTISVDETVVTLGEEYSLPSPTRNGYKFVGWTLDGKPFASAGVWEIEKDVELVATWEIRDDAGFVYEKTDDGYRVIGYKGLVKDRIIVPDIYNGELVVDVHKDSFIGLKRFLDNGEIEKILIYIPIRFSKDCDEIAFDGRVEVSRYNDMDDSGISYTKYESGYVVERYDGDVLEDIIIPIEYKGMPVIGVKPDAFNSLKTIVDADSKIRQVNIYIPDAVWMEYDAAMIGKMRFTKYSKIVEDSFAYLYQGDCATVVGYFGEYSNSLTIPFNYDGKSITGIGAYAFYGAKYKMSASDSEPFDFYIPESIEYVGLRAFAECQGVKPVLYYLNGGEIRGAQPSRIYDWLLKATIDDDKEGFTETICQSRPALGANRFNAAKYYVRFDFNGGEAKIEMELGNGETVTVNIYDDMLTYGKAYELPVPSREGFVFDGWYYEDSLVPLKGEKWEYFEYITLEAKWILEKEG